MKVYHREKRCYLDITESQFNFICELLSNCGDVQAAKAKLGVTDALLKEYQADKLFWSYVVAEVELASRASKLTPDYVKDFVRASMDPTTKVSGTQIQAAALAARICGMWNTGGGQQRTKVEITPQSVSISFDDGIQPALPQVPSKNAATAQPDPVLAPLQITLQPKDTGNGKETNP